MQPKLPTPALLPLLAFSVGAFVLTERVAPNARFELVEASEFRLRAPNGDLRGTWIATEEATTLTLGDPRGNMRLKAVANGEDGSMILMLSDNEGRARTLWGVEASGAVSFLALGDDGAPRLQLTSSVNDYAALVVRDSKGRRRCQLGVLESGAASYALFEPTGNVVAQMTTTLDGRSFDPVVSLYNPTSGELRLACSVMGGAPALTLFEEDRSMRSHLSLDGQGGGGLVWFDQEARPRAVFGITPTGSAGVMSFDPRGDVTMRQPLDFDR